MFGTRRSEPLLPQYNSSSSPSQSSPSRSSTNSSPTRSPTTSYTDKLWDQQSPASSGLHIRIMSDDITGSSEEVAGAGDEESAGELPRDNRDPHAMVVVSAMTRLPSDCLGYIDSWAGGAVTNFWQSLPDRSSLWSGAITSGETLGGKPY